MKFKLGTLELETAPAIGEIYHSLYLNAQPILMGRKPRLVYNWDCALKPGGNAARPNYFVVEVNLTMQVLNGAMGVNQAASRRVMRRMMQLSGAANLSALDTMLTAKFPPLMVKIPWPSLQRSMTRSTKIQILAWVGYRDMFIRPVPNPQSDKLLLSYPVAVRFFAIPTGLCAVGGTAGALPNDRNRTVLLRPGKGLPTEFAEEYTADLRAKVAEDPQRMRRIAARTKRGADGQRSDHHDKIRHVP